MPLRQALKQGSRLAARALTLQAAGNARTSAAVEAPQAWSTSAAAMLQQRLFAAVPAASCSDVSGEPAGGAAGHAAAAGSFSLASHASAAAEAEPAARGVGLLASDEAQAQQESQPEQQQLLQQQGAAALRDDSPPAAAAAAAAVPHGAPAEAAGEEGASAAARRPSRRRSQAPGRPPPAADARAPDRLVPLLLHQMESCAEVVGLLRQHQGDGISARELTVAFRRLGQLYTQSLSQRESSDAARQRSSGPEARHRTDKANSHHHCSEAFMMAVPQMHALDTQALATAVWMCARFHMSPPAPGRAAWERALWAKHQGVSLIEVANVMFSLGVLHWVPRGPLLYRLLDQAIARRAELTPWMLCNMLWGAARLSDARWHPGTERVRALVEVALPQLGAFTPESFCSLLFSLAALRCRPDDAVLSAILDQFEWNVPACTNRQLVTAVWALGALQLGDLVTDRLWDSVESRVLQQGDCFNFSTAPLFLFGAARMHLQPREAVLRLLVSKVEHFLPELRTGDVSVILWALARLGHKAGGDIVPMQLADALMARFLEHNKERPATLRHISALIWACSNLKYPLTPAAVRELVGLADGLMAGERGEPLTTTDANMMLNAFEALGSAEGLAFLKRHLMGSGRGVPSAPLAQAADDFDAGIPDVRPSGTSGVKGPPHGGSSSSSSRRARHMPRRPPREQHGAAEAVPGGTAEPAQEAAAGEQAAAAEVDAAAAELGGRQAPGEQA